MQNLAVGLLYMNTMNMFLLSEFAFTVIHLTVDIGDQPGKTCLNDEEPQLNNEK